jgi:(p)ppGpp synthase/HD superfamily hydrolase
MGIAFEDAWQPFPQIVADLRDKEWQDVKECYIDLIEQSHTEFRRALNQGYDFIQKWFSGKPPRKSGDPQIAHSMYLPILLKLLAEKDPKSYVTAVYHDVIEDTDATAKHLAAQECGFDLCEAVGFLTENKLLSGDFPPSRLSNRTEAFIRQLRLAPDFVLTVEIVDRFHDLADLAFLKHLSEEERKDKIAIKLVKCKNIVHHITLGRANVNADAKCLFELRLTELEARYGAAPIIPLRT